jgi:hypothetical protein
VCASSESGSGGSNVSPDGKGNLKTEHGREYAGCIPVLVILMVIFVSSCGCIRLMEQSAGSNGTQVSGEQNPQSPGTIAPADSPTSAKKFSPSRPIPAVTIATPDFITDAAPVLPPDPYPVQHGTQINETPPTSHNVRNAEFTRTYVLRGNSTGLVVNATVLEGPLRISFNVEPLYDCIEDPASCRGEAAKSISRPYFTLTVRDNQTREIVAEDGYGREYSAEKENRTINIYSEGRYHLTLTGNSVDIILSVATGNALPVSDAQSPTAGPARSDTTVSPEYFRYLRESGGQV